MKYLNHIYGVASIRYPPDEREYRGNPVVSSQLDIGAPDEQSNPAYLRASAWSESIGRRFLACEKDELVAFSGTLSYYTDRNDEHRASISLTELLRAPDAEGPYNVVMLTGNVGENSLKVHALKDDSGLAIGRFDLATTFDGNGRREAKTTWHRIILVEPVNDLDVLKDEIVARSYVAVGGSFTFRSHKDKDGERKWRPYILAESAYGPGRVDRIVSEADGAPSPATRAHQIAEATVDRQDAEAIPQPQPKPTTEDEDEAPF